MTTGKIILFCMAAALAGTFQSCLKEKKCPSPPPARLVAAVGEKNYANTGEIPQAQPVDENLPFKNYIPRLDVRYRPEGGTGSPLHRSFTPGAEEMQALLPAEMLPEGRYEIVLTGNAADENFSSAQDFLLELHPSGAESNDLYLAQGTTGFPLRAEQTYTLIRTKGLLLLYYQTLPVQIAGISLTASGVSKNVDARMNYTGTTTVTKSLPAASGPGVAMLRLAPTLLQAAPLLTISLKDSGGNSVRTLSDIALPISRNRITALELRYDPDAGSWEIWMSADGEWVRIHHLTID